MASSAVPNRPSVAASANVSACALMEPLKVVVLSMRQAITSLAMRENKVIANTDSTQRVANADSEDSKRRSLRVASGNDCPPDEGANWRVMLLVRPAF